MIAKRKSTIRAIVAVCIVVLSAAISIPQEKTTIPNNGGFEQGHAGNPTPDGWTFSWQFTHSGEALAKPPKMEPDWAWDSAQKHSGTYSVRVANTRSMDDGVWTSPQFPVVKGTKVYSASCWVKTADMHGTDARLAVVFHNAKGKWIGADYTVVRVDRDTDWKRYGRLFEVPDNAATIMVRLWLNMGYTGTGKVWFDDVEIVPTELSEMPPIQYVDRTPMPEFTPDDVERKYVLFSRNYLEMIFPNSVPRKEELNPHLTLFATPGEYETATVIIRAFGKLESVRLSATDLKTDEGNAINSECIEVNPVACILRRGQARWGEFADGPMLVPAYVAETDATDVPENGNRQIWVTIKVPEGARAGTYRGSVVLTPSNAPPAAVPLELEVLPFKLLEPTNIYWGMYARMHNDPELMLRNFRDMRDHGMTTVGACGNLGAALERTEGGVKIAFNGQSTLEIAMEAYKSAGFSRPFVWLMGMDVLRWCLKQGKLDSEDFSHCYRAAIEAIIAEGKRREWPEVIWQPLDEPFEHYTRMPTTKRCLEIMKSIPGLRTEEDGPNGRPDTLEDIYDLCDVLVYHDGPVLKRGTYDAKGWDEFLKRLKKDGKEVWFYNIDLTGYHPEVMRFGYGFGLRAAHGTGMIEWSYMTSVRPDAPAKIYSTLNRFAFRYPEADGYHGGPSIGWEATREGVDDYKYLHTLMVLADAAQRSGKQSLVDMAAEAKQFVESELSRIDFNGSTGPACQGDWTGEKEFLDNGQRAVSGSYKMQNGLSFDDYDRIRRGIADRIVRLMQSGVSPQ